MSLISFSVKKSFFHYYSRFSFLPKNCDKVYYHQSFVKQTEKLNLLNLKDKNKKKHHFICQSSNNCQTNFVFIKPTRGGISWLYFLRLRHGTG